MKVKKCLICLIALMVMSMPLFAFDLSLKQAEDLAIKENLQLKSAEVDLKMSKIAYLYSYNVLIPDAKATATFIKQNSNTSAMMYTGLGEVFAKAMPNNPQIAMAFKSMGESEPGVTFSYGISGTWTFNPAMITNIQIAYENYKNGQITFEKACAEMKKNIRKLYFGLVVQQQSLEIQKQTLDSQEQRYKQAKIDYQNGFVPEIYMLQSQVTYENAKPAYEKALLGLLSSKRSFAFLLGLDINEEFNLTTSINDINANVNQYQYLSDLEDRYDIRALASQEKLMKLRKAALVESTFLPSIVLNGSWQPAYSDLKKENLSWIDGGSLSGTVAWNLTGLLPSSTAYKNLSDIKNGMKKLKMGKSMALENAKMEILNILDSLEQAKTSIESSEGTVSLAKASYDMTLKSYNSGMSDYLDLKDAQNQLSQAQLGKLSNQYNYVCALIDLEYATGKKII